MTREKIRAALPTHIMLTPGVHKWREGDEVYLEREDVWELIDYHPQIFGNLVLPGDHNGRRPIPPRILDNQAFYLWAGQYGGVVPTWENDADVRKHIEKGRVYDKWLLEQMEDV